MFRDPSFTVSGRYGSVQFMFRSIKKRTPTKKPVTQALEYCAR